MGTPKKPWSEADYSRAGLARLSIRLSTRALLALTREAKRLGIGRAKLLEQIILEFHKRNGGKNVEADLEGY